MFSNEASFNSQAQGRHDELATLLAKLESRITEQIAALSDKVDSLAEKVEGGSLASASAKKPTRPEPVRPSVEKENEVRARRRETLMAKYAKEEVFGIQKETSQETKTPHGFEHCLLGAVMLPSSGFRQACACGAGIQRAQWEGSERGACVR